MNISKKKFLKIADVANVARKNEIVSISSDCIQAIEKSRKLVEKIIDDGKPVYGVNTGFGIFSDKRIPEKKIAQLNRNLIISHAVGTGPVLASEITRAAILVRANTLSRGYSGVRLALIQTLIGILNKHVNPIIPCQGSLGSSGDLCQLSHLALTITRDTDDLESESGDAEFEGEAMSGKKAMARAGLERIILGPKEGLALNNGATFSAAIGALAVYDAEYLNEVAEVATALSLEALLGCPGAFDERIHENRLHAGQILTAKRISKLIKGSTLIGSSKRVQDAYSLRCAPQVQGPIRETIEFVKAVIEKEINAVTDNPLIFEPGIAVSGGNFHGEPVGLMMDYLAIALCELGAISERRTFRLTDGKLNDGLPSMLVDTDEDAGLNSGIMMLQYTAASLVLENQTLATPDSIRSLPTSGGQEDHNANAMTAARHAYEIAVNLRQILSIEIFTAVRAIDLRLRKYTGRLGDGTQRAYELIRNKIPYVSGDTLWEKQISLINDMIQRRELLVD